MYKFTVLVCRREAAFFRTARMQAHTTAEMLIELTVFALYKKVTGLEMVEIRDLIAIDGFGREKRNFPLPQYSRKNCVPPTQTLVLHSV
ncbi:Uncharacterised protein [Halioglobus japonicus]|nr:Uncharacterised protein [Halioglobus japonicus]